MTKRFTSADGFIDMVTYDGITDAKAYLWITTNSGLSRYDGHSFKDFNIYKDFRAIQTVK